MELKDSPKKIANSQFIIDSNESYQSNISNDQIIDDALSAPENLGYKNTNAAKLFNQYSKRTKYHIRCLITNSLRSLKK